MFGANFENIDETKDTKEMKRCDLNTDLKRKDYWTQRTNY